MTTHPLDKTDWPIIVGAIVRVHCESERNAYTGEVVQIDKMRGLTVIYIKDRCMRTNFAHASWCEVQRQGKKARKAKQAENVEPYKNPFPPDKGE